MSILKRIRPSRRGLTFSYNESELLPIGSKYTYIVDLSSGKILITPDSNGGMTVSKKRSGTKIKPLIDIRRNDVRNLVAAADYLEVRSEPEGLCVTVYSKEKKQSAGSYGIHLVQSESKIYDIREVFGKKTGEIFVPMDVLLASGSDYPLQMYGRPTLADSSYFEHLVSGISGFPGRSKSEIVKKAAKDISNIYQMISLFSGAGLFDYAWIKDNRIQIVYANDFNEPACKTYRENIGEIKCCSIADVDEKSLPDAHIVCGGPPCQGYSAANRRNLDSSASEEKRLFIDDYIRIVKEKDPEVFVIENAPQMLTMKDGFYINRVIEQLSGRYEMSTQVIKDCDVGGFTTRKRMFAIGSRIGKISLPDIHILPMKTVGDAFSLLDDTWPNISDISKNSDKVIECMSYVRPGHNWRDIPDSVQKFAPNKHASVYHRLAMDEQSPTIVNYRKTCMIHPAENRGLSVSEASALMGLDKKFRFVGKLSDMQQQVANGVTMAMGKLVRNTVVKALDSFFSGTCCTAVAY